MSPAWKPERFDAVDPDSGRPIERPDDYEIPIGACDVCGKPHRVDLSGPRCHACRLTHGAPTVPPNPYLVRVEGPHRGQGIADHAYGWESEAS